MSHQRKTLQELGQKGNAGGQSAFSAPMLIAATPEESQVEIDLTSTDPCASPGSRAGGQPGQSHLAFFGHASGKIFSKYWRATTSQASQYLAL